MKCFAASMQHAPGANAFSTMNHLHTIIPEISANVTPEIEREADTCFQRIHNYYVPSSVWRKHKRSTNSCHQLLMI